MCRKNPLTILQKTKKTNKKFYNKWLYKISIKCNGATMFRMQSLENLKEFSTSDESTHRSHSIASRNYKHRDEIGKLANFLLKHPTHIWGKRIESTIFDLYTNDQEFYNLASIEFEDCLIHRFEPDLESIDTLNNASAIIVKKLPHDLYNYRVYLLPHTLAKDMDAKKKYIEWIKAQGDKMTFTPAIESWFLKTDWNWDRRYILVDNEQTLLLLKLRNAQVVGRIYKFVISDK